MYRLVHWSRYVFFSAADDVDYLLFVPFYVDNGIILVEAHFFPDAGWEMMSIPPDSICTPGDSTRKTMPISANRARVPTTGGNASDDFFVHLYGYDGILVEVDTGEHIFGRFYVEDVFTLKI